jgi:hypothetical protein
MPKKIVAILMHSLGASVLAGSLIWMLITYMEIFTKHSVIYNEPNPLILSIETSLTVYGMLYLAYIYPKLLQEAKKTKEVETNKLWAEEHLKMQLSLWQRLVLKINGHVFLRYEKRQGWKDYLPIYLVKCPHCKQYFTDYPHYYCTYFIHANCEKGGH